MEYKYTGKNISSPQALHRSCLEHGLSDAAVTLSEGNVLIYTASEDKPTVDSAVEGALDGGLLSNKILKTSEVESKSNQLIQEGVDCWDGNKAELSKAIMDERIADLEYLNSNPDKISDNIPYIVRLLTGGVSFTTQFTDVKTLVDNSVDRMIYLYTSVLNGDGSEGELTIIQKIEGCTTQGELDAIEDKRM